MRRQTEAGIDIVTDGEVARVGFIPYVNERLSGIEPSAKERRITWRNPESIALFRNSMPGPLRKPALPASPAVYPLGNAGAYSGAANPRHEHEWAVWQTVTLPAGKCLIPGVITHSSNIVDHPEAIGQRIGRLAKAVGRENVIAGADCGFASFASTCEAHPSVVWVKLEALAKGARLASKQLWA